jgi:chromosomal replication initiation ATPase DnaA
MSEGMSHCEIAAAWSEQRNYLAPINVWRQRRSPPSPVLPMDGPRTLEEMVSAHKARRASERNRLRAILEEARLVREWNKKAEQERIAALRAKYERRQSELGATATYPSIRKIIISVAQAYGVKTVDMMSARRTADVVLPRQVAMYLAKVTTLRSLPDVGRQFGGKDHTTILHAVRKIAARMAVDDSFRAKVEALRAEVAPQTDEAANG